MSDYPLSRTIRNKIRRETALQRAAQFRHLPTPRDFEPRPASLPTPAAAVPAVVPPVRTGLQRPGRLVGFEKTHPALELVASADCLIEVRRAVPDAPAGAGTRVTTLDLVVVVRSEQDRALAAGQAIAAARAAAPCRIVVADARGFQPAAARAAAVRLSDAPTLDFATPTDDLSTRPWWPSV